MIETKKERVQEKESKKERERGIGNEGERKDGEGGREGSCARAR